MSRLLAVVLTAIGLTAAGPAALAQIQASGDIPGGATGSTVYCLQAGDLTSGAFVGTFLQTGTGAWEERLKAGTFRLAERKREDLTLELADNARSAAVQFDFVNRVVKYRAGSGNWVDRYYILNATDRAGSTDCVALANMMAPGQGAGPGQAAGGPDRGPGGAGGPGSGGAQRPAPNNPTIVVVVPPRTPLNIPPGTQFTGIGGPPCPGNPGFFLCPNKFSCAPIGGVCCPGANACNAGTFCDLWIPGNCIVPSDARFCPGTGDRRTGLSLHCAPGLACISNSLCQ